jgi:hypothetical protein
MVHNLNRPLLLSSDQQLWIQGRRKCNLMLQTHRQPVPGIQAFGAQYDFSKLQWSWSSVGEIPWNRPAVTYCPLIRAMPLIDGARRTGTRLFLRMPRMCGKHFDTAEESTGFVSLRTVAGRWRNTGLSPTPSSGYTSSSLWLPSYHSRRLLIATSSTEAHATSSQAKQTFQRCAP